MLKFAEVGQEMPDKRPVSRRRSDWGEIYAGYDEQRAALQSARCSQCGIPFCQIHCPVHNNIPDWLKLVVEGRMEEAYELSQSTNNLPEICGRICPHDRLCEGNCVIEKGFDAVTIGSVEKYITDTAWQKGWVKPVVPRRERPQSVGIIGAGPGGMTAAEELRRLGYQAHIYDRNDRPGGLLMYGIPSFKLEKHIVDRRTELLKQSGVVFHCDVEVGRDVSFEALRHKHQAILIATGVYKARDIAVPGVGLDGIVAALDYLIASNMKGLGRSAPAFESGVLNAAGKSVIVVGGGDTAMDCVRTAVRQGAKSVKCLYRRDRANMPGSMREVSHAEDEGIDFVWLSSPRAFLGDGHVDGVRMIRMRLGQPDSSGRQTPRPIDGSEMRLDADLVVKALGFDPENLPASLDAPDLATTNWGTVAVDFNKLSTSMPGVFAVGDVVRGASLVVWAIRDGRLAASEIHKYLSVRAEAIACAS